MRFFTATEELQRAARLSRLLGDVISGFCNDDKFKGQDDLSDIRKISAKLTNYIDQAARGDRTADWFKREALVLRAELNRLAIDFAHKSDVETDISQIKITQNNKIVTGAEIKKQIALAGIEDSDQARYFLKIAHEILDKIDDISDFSNDSPYRSRIVRTIKPKPEHEQIVSSVLNYFSRILKMKGISENVKIKTESKGGEILFVVEFDPCNATVIDKMFYDYGDVVSGKMLPGDLFDSSAHALELKNKLEITELELKQTTQILHLEREGTSARISDLESEVEWLRKTFEKSIHQSDKLSEEIAKIAKQSSSSVRKNFDIILRRTENGLSESDRSLVERELVELAKREPKALKLLKTVIEKSVVSASSSQLGRWIDSVMRSIS
ncbi:hypothetical protein [Roseibium sp. MMSF_3544]|uniref:hypothetical protein n=1 Tax=unclassified Roseibium TaxID=2629323 RepID=UPI00273E6D81|nr:hypothetical protein [Roseibium sp. MMSF_3544]